MSETAMSANTGEANATATPKEIEEGKLMALLSYVICIIAIVPFVQKNNSYSLYHAKQGLTLLIAAVAVNVAFFLVGMILGMIGLSIIGRILSLAVLVAIVGLIVIGAMNAWNGRMQPLPVIGKYADVIFKGAK